MNSPTFPTYFRNYSYINSKDLYMNDMDTNKEFGFIIKNGKIQKELFITKIPKNKFIEISKYVYNEDECCNKNELKHVKTIYPFIDKMRIECTCGGWQSYR